MRSTFGTYLPRDPRARFAISDPAKRARIPASDELGSFDAWADRISINLEVDPIGTAVHELLHANAYSDDWLPADTGRDEITSFRGFELQRLTADRSRVLAIYHRGLNESVTECLTAIAYPAAITAYADLAPIATTLVSAIGSTALAHAYFTAGYPGLEAALGDAAQDISRRADLLLWRKR